jgi:hypothetical protein
MSRKIEAWKITISSFTETAAGNSVIREKVTGNLHLPQVVIADARLRAALAAVRRLNTNECILPGALA